MALARVSVPILHEVQFPWDPYLTQTPNQRNASTRPPPYSRRNGQALKDQKDVAGQVVWKRPRVFAISAFSSIALQSRLIIAETRPTAAEAWRAGAENARLTVYSRSSVRQAETSQREDAVPRFAFLPNYDTTWFSVSLTLNRQNTT